MLLCKTIFNTSSLLMKQTRCEVTGSYRINLHGYLTSYVQPTIWAMSLPLKVAYHLVASYDTQDRDGTIQMPKYRKLKFYLQQGLVITILLCGSGFKIVPPRSCVS